MELSYRTSEERDLSQERLVMTEPDILTLAHVIEVEGRWPMADRRDLGTLRRKLAEATGVPEAAAPPRMSLPWDPACA